MNSFSHRVIAGFLALLLPVVAQAGPPKLLFSGGAVSIDADAVPLRTILDEWATLGGTRLEGIEQLSDVVITLHVAAIAEGDALDALLKGRHGYATVPRKPGEAGASRFARIVVFSSIAQPATDAANKRRVVPDYWPFPVNEHPIDADAHAPRKPSATVEGIPGISTPWPFPVNLTPDTDAPAPGAPPAAPAGVPGIDVPWPFPVNVNPVDLDPPAPLSPPAAGTIPGIDMPWPFPVNLNAVDPDAPSVAPAPAGPPAADAAAAFADLEMPRVEGKSQTDDAPVRTVKPPQSVARKPATAPATRKPATPPKTVKNPRRQR